MKVNKNFENLVPNYLFADVARKTNEFAAAHPEKEIIRLGIGDVTLPLAPIVVEAMKKGCEDLKYKDTFKGYPEYEGYDFVREAIAGYYKSFGVQVAADEIFVSDGAKSDCGNLPDIFAQDNTVLVTDPVYPVYVDANIMAGRRIIYAASNKENHFLAMPDERVKADIIYLCSPNNPTGAAYSAEQLQAWVEYALKNDAVILYDAAYEAFIADDSPRSIFAVDGARECAIELCSLSKTAGFTGTRCGYTVIPKELRRGGHSLHALWYRRQDNLNYYRRNAQVISSALDALGIYYTGGKNAPYIWMECPDGMGSWQFFDYLLQNAAVVGTPGEGFGENGKGYFRLTSFGSYEKTTEAVERIRSLLR